MFFMLFDIGVSAYVIIGVFAATALLTLFICARNIQLLLKVWFWLYCITLALLVFLPIASFSDNGFVTRPVENHVNLIFSMKKVFRYESFFMDFCVNILMFAPMGFFVRLFSKSKQPFLTAFAVCIIASLCIEVVQLMLPTRVSDVNDVVTNTVGALIGILCASAACKIRKNIVN